MSKKQTQTDGVTVDFFRGRQGRLWLTLLILSPVLAAAFVAFAVLYADDGLIVVIGCIAVAVVCLVVFGVCVGTAKMRTSRWVADAEGVSYHCLGRRVTSLRWEEMREAGFLRLGAQTRATRLRLYWSGNELRGKLRSGKFEGKERGLGANERGASLIVYTVPAYYADDGSVTYPADDPLVLYTKAHFRRSLRHEELLQTKE